MFADLEIMKIHVSALFTHNAELRLLFVNEPDKTTLSAPRLFLGRTRTGNVWRFRADLPEKLCNELDALCADEPFVRVEFNEPPRHLETYIRLLEADAAGAGKFKRSGIFIHRVRRALKITFNCDGK